MGKTIKTYAIIVLLSILSSLFISEIYLRWYFRDPERLYVLPPNSVSLYQGTPQGTPGVTELAHFRINSLGLRGDEPFPDRKRVIYVFGGSTSIDVWLDQPKAWPQVLQDTLNRVPGQPKTWVANISKWGLSTHHNLIHFHDVMPYLPKPNISVVLAGINDMQRALKTSYPGEITPEFDRQLAYDYAPPHDNAFLSTFGFYRLYMRWREVKRKEALGRALGGGGDVLLPMRKCRQSQREEDLVAKYPDITTELEDYRNRLNQLVDLSAQKDAITILATQPSLWKKDMAEPEKKLLLTGGLAPLPQWGTCEAMKYYSPEAMEDALHRFNQVMLDVCEARHLICVDLEKIVPKEAKYFYDDVHFTEYGSALVAKSVADAVIRFGH